MASAYAKFTGELGVCTGTSDPGASHLITRLYDARMDHMPVLAIAGQQARTVIGRHYQLELDLGSMFDGGAVSYAITAKIAHPDRPLVALVGDGAMQMNKMAELITIAKYWREWPNPPW